MNNSSQQYTVISDMFRDKYSVTLFRFGQIVKIASEVNDENDLLYLDGRIDDFLAGSKIFFIESVFSIEKSQLDTIIIPDLQQPIEELFSLIYDYIDNLNYIVEKKDIEAIKSMRYRYNLHQDERKHHVPCGNNRLYSIYMVSRGLSDTLKHRTLNSFRQIIVLLTVSNLILYINIKR